MKRIWSLILTVVILLGVVFATPIQTSAAVSDGIVEVEPQSTKELVSVEISNNPTKTSYEIGESFDTSELVLNLTYSDNSTENITSGFDISGFDSTTAGTKIVTVCYQGFTDSFIVTVNDPSVTIVAQGECDYSLIWNLYSDGKLTIKKSNPNNSGDMYDYAYRDYPWTQYRSKIETIEILEGVTSIGSLAFTNCDNLTTVVFPSTMKSIGAQSFQACDSLESVTILGNNAVIGNFAFDSCHALKSLVLSEGVTEIGSQAFYDCPSLTALIIPKSVTEISSNAFIGCSGLETIIVEDGNSVYHSDGNCLIYTSAGWMRLGCKNSIIPDDGSVVELDQSAFQNCTSLTSITIPEGVKEIGYRTFSGCTNLTSITIARSVTTIGQYAFTGCDNLTIYGYPNTNVSAYADNNDIPFVNLIEGIEIVSTPTKTIYYINDSLNTSGLKLQLNCADGTTKTITSGFSISGFSSTSAGTKTVTISYEGFTDTFTVTVKTPSIILSSSSKTMVVGETSTITATTIPSGQTVTWASSNTSVATVSGGTITAKAPVSTTITAKFTYNGITYSETCVVTVTENTKPTVSIITTDLIASTQTATLHLSDNVGVVGYYWGTNSKPTFSEYTTISSTTSTSIQKTVSSSGVYYLFARDAAGNVSIVETITYYNTTFDANGGSVSPTSVLKKKGNSFTASIPTRFGYKFKGWSTSSTDTSGSTTITPTSNTTYYAVWQAPTTLSVNSTNTASISSGGEMKYYSYTPSTSGKYVIYSTATVDTKVYLYDSDGIELDSDDDGGDSTNFRLEYNLTAGEKYYFGVKYYNSSNTGSIPFKFGRVYTITYNANGGSGAPSTQYKDYGTSITLSTEKPTKSNYTFAGWATSSTATSASYQPGDTYSTESNSTLYAVWTPVDTTKPTVSISSTNLVASSQTATLSLSDNVGVVSYYWGTSSSPSSSSFTTISSTTSTSIQKTVSSSGTYYLFAKDAAGNVSIVATITFYKTTLNANGGSVSPTSMLTKSGNSVTLPTPTRSGYIFVGWGTSATSTSGVTSVTVTSSRTYYAVWTPADTTKPTVSVSSTNLVASSQTVTLSMSDNVGVVSYYWGTSSSPSSSSFTTISSTTSTSIQKTVSSSGTYYLIAKDAAGNVSSTASITYYKTTLNANDGTVSPTSVLTKSGNTVTLPTPTRSGYSFVGWGTSTTSTSGVTYITANANKTYYAVWDYIDTTKPTVSVSSTNLVSASQTATLSLSDNVGVVSYYWGTSSSPSSSSYTTITSTKSTSIQKTVSSSGTYYLIAKDADGNVSTSATITFYKTTLNANGGSVSPASVLTKSGETVILPTPTRANYGFAGWGTTSTATSGINALTVYENRTYYAIWSDKDTKNPTVSVRSTNNVASSQTATLVMSDNIGVVSYYWGKSASPSSGLFTSIASATSKSVDVSVYESGTYYLIAKDAEGNSSITAATFYTTTLNANGGTVSPSSILTKSGNTVTLPTPVRNSYKYLGWNVSSTATSGNLSVSVTSNRTYYAVWEYIHTCSFTGEEEIVIEATCTENGSKIVHCTEPSCSKVQTVVIEAYGHSEGEWEVVKPVACLENGLKERRCPDCDHLFESEIIYSTGHSMGEWYVYRKPGFYTQGEERKDCANCDYFDYKFIPATNIDHQCDFTGEEEIVFAATCTESGSKKIYCFEPECGEYILETIESFGHSLGDWQVYKEAKFHEEGEERKTCEHCAYFEYRPIPKTSIGHKCKFTGKEEFTVKATCTSDGRKKVYCFEPECGKYKEVEAKRTGHNISDWTVYTEVQFHIDGEERKTCANCGFYESRVIPKLSESHTCSFTGRVNVVFEPTCTETGLKKTYCIEPECGKYLTETPEALGHTESEFMVLKDATCTEDGTKQQKCTVCDEILKTEVITAYGHEYNDWTVIKEATDTEAGEKTRECFICHYVESEIVDPLVPPTTTPDEEKTDLGLLGDVNGDGKVNIKDATMIQKAAAKITALLDDEKLRADVNADTKNNVKDATAIQKFVAKIETGYPIGEKIK